MRTLVRITFVVVVSGCAASVPDDGVTKPQGGKFDSSATSKQCEALGEPANCDLCDAAGWYGDGECDTFCTKADSDCSAVACDEGPEIVATSADTFVSGALSMANAAGGSIVLASTTSGDVPEDVFGVRLNQRNENGTWSTERVSHRETRETAVGVDAEGTTWVAYIDVAPQPILYVTSKPVGGTWTETKVGDGEESLSMVIDAKGTVWVAYVVRGGLTVARRQVGKKWATATVDSGVKVISPISLDADGSLRVLYRDGTGILKLATRPAGRAWKIEEGPVSKTYVASVTGDNAGNTWAFTAEYIGESGDEYDFTAAEYELTAWFHKGTGPWVPTVLDTAQEFQHPVAKVGPDGTLRVSYGAQKGDFVDVTIATLDTAAKWNTDLIEVVNAPSTEALRVNHVGNADGNVWIAYTNPSTRPDADPSDDLRVAARCK